MKLTKETLRRIIKEELEATMEEGLFGFPFKKKKGKPVEQPAEKTKSALKTTGHSIEDLKSAIKKSSVHPTTKETAVELVDEMGNRQSLGWIDTNFNGLRDAEDKESFLSTMISDLEGSGGL